MAKDLLVQLDRGGESPAVRKARGKRLPAWLRNHTQTHHQSVTHLKASLRDKDLNTVCESARCPNLHECFHRGTATFMILGNLCTRGCGFCSVPKGLPGKHAFLLDPNEPSNVASMAKRMGLRYVVITSVNRDDLPDGGSIHFAKTVEAVRQSLPDARIEVLIPDFCGDLQAVQRVLDAAPDVLNHNMETVRRLYRRVRPQADYEQSLRVLEYARRQAPGAVTKSGLMVGLGEEPDEVQGLMRDVRAVSVDVLAIGQYLQPTRKNLPVESYVTPQQFENYRDYGLSLGFREIFSGPLVRNSYMADQVWENL